MALPHLSSLLATFPLLNSSHTDRKIQPPLSSGPLQKMLSPVLCASHLCNHSGLSLKVTFSGRAFLSILVRSGTLVIHPISLCMPPFKDGPYTCNRTIPCLISLPPALTISIWTPFLQLGNSLLYEFGNREYQSLTPIFEASKARSWFSQFCLKS